MSKYNRLTYTDRIKIETLYNRKTPVKDIASYIGCSHQTIYNELKRGLYEHRNTDLTTSLKYSSDKAQAYININKKHCGCELKINFQQALFITALIRRKYSARVVAFKCLEIGLKISYSTIYNYIHNNVLLGVGIKDLIYKKRPKVVRYKPVKRVKLCPSISDRPDSINSREEFGHWEIDSVVGSSKGKNESVLVLTERKTRFEIIRKVEDKTAKSTVTALQSIIKNHREIFKTLTCDNGVEFSDYDGMKNLVDEVYYCQPYSSWQRGTNENNNRFIRRFFPKGTSFAHLTNSDFIKIQEFMNDYPREKFGYLTSKQLFEKEIDVIYDTKTAIINELYEFAN